MAPGSAYHVACRLSVYYQHGVNKYISCTKYFWDALGLDIRPKIVDTRICLWCSTCVLASVLIVDLMHDLG